MRAAGPILASLVAGCSAIHEFDEVQCRTDSDCSLRGFKRAECQANTCVSREGLGCLARSPLVSPPSEARTVQLALYDAVSNPRLGGATGSTDLEIVAGEVPADEVKARPCSASDPNCNKPLGDWRAMNSSGVVTLPVTGRFSGYLELTAQEAVPELVYLGRLLPGEEPATYPVIYVGNAIFDVWTLMLDTTLNAERGHVVGFVYDCADVLLKDVAITVDSTDLKSTTWYVYNAVPDPKAKATDETGVGGVYNLPVPPAGYGTTHIRAVHQPSGAEVGSAQVVIRKGWLSVVHMRARAPQAM
jgi:hypothetical protein